MSYKDLAIWKRSINMVEEIYIQTAYFPKSETFGISNQMRRSAVSVASNIAEGHSRNSTSEYINFLYYSKASLSELETQAIIVERLKYIDEIKIKQILTELEEMTKMITGLIRALKEKRKG